MGGEDPVTVVVKKAKEAAKQGSDAISNATGGAVDIAGAVKNYTNFATLGFAGRQIYGTPTYGETGLGDSGQAQYDEIIKDPTVAEDVKKNLINLYTNGKFSEANAMIASISSTKDARVAQNELAKYLLQNPGQKQTLLTGNYATGAQEKTKKTLLGGG